MEGYFIINGTEKKLAFEPDATLLEVLRENGNVEVKRGCDTGECGSCSVLLDGKLVTSCKIYAASVMGHKITTVKGLGTVQNPHPIQQAFVDAGAVQCGFCTPGMVLATYALLVDNPDPDDDEIRRALDGNKCRCSGYVKIFDAVKLAAKRMREDG